VGGLNKAGLLGESTGILRFPSEHLFLYSIAAVISALQVFT